MNKSGKIGCSTIIFVIIASMVVITIGGINESNKYSRVVASSTQQSRIPQTKNGKFPLEEWCRKFASLEDGGRYLERQFFLLFDVLDAELPDATVERIVTTTFSIWSDNFQSQGFSNSYHNFIRNFKIEVENYQGEKDFDDLFKAYCIALLAEAHIPD